MSTQTLVVYIHQQPRYIYITKIRQITCAHVAIMMKPYSYVDGFSPHAKYFHIQ